MKEGLMFDLKGAEDERDATQLLSFYPCHPGLTDGKSFAVCQMRA
jgi:hypothetical protein